MMKYIYTLTLVTAVIFVSSCRKSHDCKCTTTMTNTSNGSTISTSTTSPTGKMTKANAKTWCESDNSSYSSGGYDYDVSCELD